LCNAASSGEQNYRIEPVPIIASGPPEILSAKGGQ
jgi:hypothetical protein